MSLPQPHPKKNQRLKRSSPKNKRHVKQRRKWNQHELQALATAILVCMIAFVAIEDFFYRDQYNTEITRLKKLTPNREKLNTEVMLRSSLQAEYRQALRNASGYLRKFNHSKKQDETALLLAIQQLRIAEQIANKNGSQRNRIDKLRQRLVKLESQAEKLGIDFSTPVDLNQGKTPNTPTNKESSP